MSANVGYWRRLDKPQLGLLNTVSEFIFRKDLEHPFLLRDLRQGRLVVASDYGGEHKASAFATYSFLLCNDDSLSSFTSTLNALRRGALGQERRMAYKGLGDRVRAAALGPYLGASNTIHGVLFTVALEKSAELFSDEVIDADLQLLPGIKRATAIKMLTVSHWLSLLVSGLVGPAQDVIWLSDRDSIAANPHHARVLSKTFGHLLNHYLNCDVGHIRVGTTQNDPGNLSVEDLAALPDLAAGALSAVVTDAGIRERNDVAPKTHPIVEWLLDDRGRLAKVSFVIRRRKDGGNTIQLLSRVVR